MSTSPTDAIPIPPMILIRHRSHAYGSPLAPSLQLRPSTRAVRVSAYRVRSTPRGGKARHAPRDPWAPYEAAAAGPRSKISYDGARPGLPRSGLTWSRPARPLEEPDGAGSVASDDDVGRDGDAPKCG